MSRSLTFRIKKYQGSFALDVTLSVGTEILVLFGPSGSGKSTLLNCIAGLTRPDEGEIWLGDRLVFQDQLGKVYINEPPRRRRVGYLFQNYALFPHMTVLQNVCYGVANRAEKRDTIRALLNMLRLNGLEHRYPKQLSGGQQQRVALARALASEPDLLLLDEPFSALDNQVRDKLIEDLVHVHQTYLLPAVLVTHDITEAFALGQKIAVINNGSIEQVGSPEEVFYRPATRNVARFVGTLNIYDAVVGYSSNDAAVLEGEKFRVVVSNGNNYYCGQKLTFCIRPELVKIFRDGDTMSTDFRALWEQGNVFAGVVTRILDRGTSRRIYIALRGDGYDIVADVPRTFALEKGFGQGSKVMVGLEQSQIHVIGPAPEGGSL